MSLVDNIFNDLERYSAATAVYCDTAFNSMPSIAAHAQCGSKKKKKNLTQHYGLFSASLRALPRAVTLN